MNDQKHNDIDKKELSEGFLKIRLSLIEYANTHTLDELLSQALDEVGILLDSPIGFYHFVDSDQKSLSLQQWSTRTLKEFCRAEGKGTHYSIDQAGVWVDCLPQKKAVIHNDYSSLPHKKGMPEGHAKVVRELVAPVIRKDKAVAILGVGNKPTDYTQRDVEIVSYLADVTWEIIQQKRADDALRKTTLELQERIKELSCLYSISKLAEEDGLTIDAIIQRTVDLIPQAWQYPEITCARIELNNHSYRTKHFTETVWSQSREIRVNKEKIGILEVFICENKSEKDEGLFLPEERSLLNAIAERLGHIIESKQANEALQKAHDELQLRVKERTRELAAQNQHLLNEISERKKAEEELQRSSEKIKLFAYSVAHDLKNPTIAILGLARILNNKYGNELTGRGKIICEQIQRSSEDIASLVDKINIFISAKETLLNMKEISLEKIFPILQEEFFIQLNTRSVQWVISDNIPGTIVADRLSIIRIFRNIIENSLKHGGYGLTRIEIGYRLADDLHIFTVTDDGQGLKGKDSENIFNWFNRETSSTENQGSGLGLAIVKEIAALHGGAVWQEPAKPQGVTFFVSLSIRPNLRQPVVG
ncbi:MAG: GAF domain-containing sensor histidine kinase [Proteobacteria bacterium]|nr:GAF domain-containing sensor histidine kinase [Pseudomonadota bacterium]